jgi:hypothetical protein
LYTSLWARHLEFLVSTCNINDLVVSGSDVVALAVWFLNHDRWVWTSNHSQCLVLFWCYWLLYFVYLDHIRRINYVIKSSFICFVNPCPLPLCLWCVLYVLCMKPLNKNYCVIAEFCVGTVRYDHLDMCLQRVLSMISSNDVLTVNKVNSDLCYCHFCFICVTNAHIYSFLWFTCECTTCGHVESPFYLNRNKWPQSC